jgi:type II secretory pathway pseudopilin PulG
MRAKGKETGFTIVELLTVMSIIIILISLLLPSLAAVRRYSKDVRQKGQFHDIENCLEMFSINYDGYPDSSWSDLEGDNYCGAMKLCEALLGQDGFGFHPDSYFDNMGRSKAGAELYYNRRAQPDIFNKPEDAENLRKRRIPCMEKTAPLCLIETLFKNFDDGFAPFDANCPLLCDVYTRSQLLNARGDKMGMPILYFKADPSKLTHDAEDGYKWWPQIGTNIYNYYDNHELLALNPPWAEGREHPMFAPTSSVPKVFYDMTLSEETSIGTYQKPHNPHTYILISAGWDGIYGTGDDIFNFYKK